MLWEDCAWGSVGGLCGRTVCKVECVRELYVRGVCGRIVCEGSVWVNRVFGRIVCWWKVCKMQLE